MIRIQTFCCFLFYLLNSSITFSQDFGNPLIRNYSPEEYHGYFQNWAIEQDRRGVIYIANGKGILEFNGINWRRFPTEKRTTVLSLGKDNKGRIYVGAEGEIGFLAPDSTGLINYVSLLDKVPEQERNFTYVWHTYPTAEGVYFVTPEKVIRISKTKTKIWKPEKAYFTGFYVNNTFYIVDTQKGLLQLKNDSLIPIENAKDFLSVRTILHYQNQVLIYDSYSGFYLYDGVNKPVRFQTDAEKYLKKHKIYKGIALPDNSFAFASLNSGVMLMSSTGKITGIINKKNGLIGSAVYNLFVDSQGELWVALENGLSRIEVSAPFTFFSEQNGLKGIVQDIKRINNNLYVASLGGVFKLENSFSTDTSYYPATFSQITKMNFQSFMISNIEDQLFFTGAEGLFTLKNGEVKNIFNPGYLISIIKSEYYSNTLFLGGAGELYCMRYLNKKWEFVTIFEKRVEDIYSIAEQDANTLWLGTVSHGLLKVSILDSVDFHANIFSYDSLKGVPAGMVEVSKINNRICIGSDKGIFSYNKQNDKFLPDTSWGKFLADGSTSVYLLKNDYMNNLWAMLLKTIGYATKEKDSYHWFELPFLRLKINDLYIIYPETTGICWIGGTDGIIRYDANKNKNYKTDFSTIIQFVYTKKDTVFRGAWPDKDRNISFIQPEYCKRNFQFKQNAVTFEFAAPSFDNEESNVYKFYLEGFDETWSDWTSIIKKEYTNLPEGHYNFRVVGRNIYGVEGRQAVYSFTILPPWYRTFWAYGMYVVLSILFIYLIVKLNSRRLIAKI